MSEFVIVLTTFPADGDADALARTLVTGRLAACVNVLAPMRSIYMWKGAVEDASERQLVIKTTAARVAELQDHLKALHPYEIPEFLVIPIVDGSHDYLSWVTENTRKAVDP